MLYLCFDLQLVIDSLYDGSLHNLQFVRNAHQLAFHVVSQLRVMLYAVNEKTFKDFFTYISIVNHEYPVDELHESLVFQGILSSTFPCVIMKLSSSPFSK